MMLFLLLICSCLELSLDHPFIHMSYLLSDYISNSEVGDGGRKGGGLARRADGELATRHARKVLDRRSGWSERRRLGQYVCGPLKAGFFH